MVKQFKILVEKHPDGFVAYPLGIKGVVVGEGDTYEEALADVNSAIQFHIETFGPEMLEDDQPTLEAFIAETRVSV
ncbi:MAG TPA: type II toxin-antitoxin system HicB family antitoxin [Anaerolineae bacterium]|jgi:predicted RNase H-like HicB family nuclease|nr:type II toxin-antitoxin system HicB family antitoxin [Anaerolineae bacterium]